MERQRTRENGDGAVFVVTVIKRQGYQERGHVIKEGLHHQGRAVSSRKVQE